MHEMSFSPDSIQAAAKPIYPFQNNFVVVLVLLVILVVSISCVTEIEIVSTVDGSIAPISKSHTMRSDREALLKTLHAEEGQLVRKSQLLLELDTQSNRFELNGLELLRKNKQQKLLALAALQQTFVPELKSQKPALLQLPNQNRYSKQIALRFETYQHQYQDIHESIQMLKAEQALEATRLAQSKALLPFNQLRLKASEALIQKGYASKLETLEHQSLLAQQRAQILISQQIISNYQLKIKALTHDQLSIADSFKLQLAEQISTLEMDVEALTQQINSLQNVIDKAKIRSPINGYVQELSTLIQGTYIEAGQVLLKIVPEQSDMIVKANVPNNDRGFITQGQSARVKVDAFPYTRYGSLPAEVKLLSRDSTLNKDGALVYPIEFTLLRNRLTLNGKRQPIRYGMSVKVDVITGSRTLISYFTDPISHTLSKSLVER
ncbi:HlyD family type I secretion periplasmic adaptor subunit [Alginatibacterium sediminis]|uniref:Membrane fusion protein (MFP) family protein n=1 Tax=Alginatibacterium sediminis TaxID=2164068 RepID=A0A420EAT0_9ALTE|nr:HlyD family type I secretion periplasmic adaptor subunit [Alginatibacterium sediminis]RKF17785.1 HlyD family type I secretion periplasmic adaptor subunit [Alginatibacterium sediminis]